MVAPARKRVSSGRLWSKRQSARAGSKSLLAGQSAAQENGWQLKHTCVEDRTLALFNSRVMSDVTLVAEGHEIPGHLLILCSASPVFYHRLFEAPVEESGAPKWSRLWECPMSKDIRFGHGHNHRVQHLGGVPPGGTPSCPLRLETDFKYDNLFEFLKYLYTDKVFLTVDNAMPLLMMADDFKMPDLFDKCMEFLREAVHPSTVLRLTVMSRQLLCKAVIVLWRDLLDSRKAQQHFEQLHWKERLGRMKDYMKSPATSRAASRTTSRANSRAASRQGSNVNFFDFQDGATSSRPSSPGGGKANSARPTLVLAQDAMLRLPGRSDVLEEEAFDIDEVRLAREATQHAEQAALGVKDVYKLTDVGRRLRFLSSARGMAFQLAHGSQHLTRRCWMCVELETEAVVSSPSFKNQKKSLVAEVLSLEHANVREIDLFRAAVGWAQHQLCLQHKGLLPENIREELAELLPLIRFPTMSMEEILWEVAPVGALSHQDMSMLRAVMTGEVNIDSTWFIVDARKTFTRMAAMLKSKKEAVPEAFAGESREAAPPSSLYTPAEGDVLDAVLGCKLYRDHVRDSVQSQHEARMAQEAGVPPAPSHRAVFCGTPDSVDAKLETPPCFRNVELAVMGTRRAPMQLLGQTLQTSANAVAVDHSPDGLLREKAVSTDFQRQSPGLYNFKEDRLIEMRLEAGEPYVYEHRDRPATHTGIVGEGPDSVIPAASQRPYSAGHAGQGGAALRARLGLLRKVHLDGFLNNCTSL
eukprot:TRINITY_DN36675_c0_g1_i1.p1 TRINITY_DN36675_c0_g1~~TRINITY_DN36675_c0_g1_i1.p1  ORF type:complete len:754 (-),score=166.53 TRINITY_DN36675_c0_g1_i1:40-2301(-)